MDNITFRSISLKIATKVMEEAFKDGMASLYPEPQVDICTLLQN